MERRRIRMHDTLRYARKASPLEITLDGYLNYYFLTSSPANNLPQIMLERGINATANVTGPDGPRRPVIAIRSSPWKAGHSTNPWHDEFDLDRGRVRYYGDHKPSTLGSPGATPGNRALLEAWRLHAGTSIEERLLAPPLLLFRSTTIERDGHTYVKGHVEFCGVAVIERLEHVVQHDPGTGYSFPNIAVDLAVVDVSESSDSIDMRWIDDRRDAALDSVQAVRHAPLAWNRWIREGQAATPRIRRRVVPLPRNGS